MIIKKVKSAIKFTAILPRYLYNKWNIYIPKVKSIDLTINKINNERKSLVRYGDGEIDLIEGKSIKFQKYDVELSNRLKEILKIKSNIVLVGIPDVFESLKKYRFKTRIFWYSRLSKERIKWHNILNLENTYYDAYISRPYFLYRDRRNSSKRFENVKSIWKNKHIIIVEGEHSRLGIGNDLFKYTKSIKRIICPNYNAFNKFNEIKDMCKKQDKSSLILIALGPTATVLAYDLAVIGFQAIDIGHIDIEYEWFIKGCRYKEAIEGKYTNEAMNTSDVEYIFDNDYENQIIAKIL